MAAANDVDIDRIVDYRAEYSQVIKKHQFSGDNIIGLCPFHEDKNNSFSANLKTGKWHCFSEDRGGNFVTFYAELNGIDTKEAYRQILEKYGVSLESEQKPVKAKKQVAESYTLAQYSFEKRLPEDFLKETFHLETAKDRDGVNYIRIPYYNEEGKEATYRKRYGHKDFRWKYGSSGKICLYAEWKIPEYRKAGYVVMVEGESDTQSMIFMGVPTLGVPGASMFKKDQADKLQDFKVYLHIEPDKGGETFLAKMTAALREHEFIGEVYTWSCKSLGVKDPSELFIKYGKEEAGKKIQHLLQKAEKIDIYDLSNTIPEAIKGAPVNLRQPEGWIYSEKGISRIDEKKAYPVMICRTPIILTQRLKSMETGEEKMQIAFKRDGEWSTAIFPRSIIFQSRSITTLSDLGCTVTSENAKQVVRFLEALEAENIDIIKKAESTSTFGWKPKGRFLPGHGGDIVLDIEPTQRPMVAAYCVQGTMEKWVERMKKHRERDKFRFILSASFTAPLLRIIRQRIFFVYNWGGSKGGKTAALKAALSAWGDPERLMVNFNATQVALERMAGFYCDLPLGIDERQLAGQNQGSIEKIVYMLASGTGKARGSKTGGLQTLQTWRTIALATGEEPLSTETSQTGVSTRVLEIYGGPFDDEQEASLMHQQCSMNCGWAGPEFVKRIMAMDEDDIRNRYEIMTEFVREKADGKSGSHIAAIAAVALADSFVDEWFFNGKDSEQRARKMAASILQEQLSAGSGDVNENATQFIVDWILSNKAQFGEGAVGTCLGMMSGQNAYIFPSMLNQALQKAGYSPRKTMKYLADNNLIGTSPKQGGGRQNSVIKWFNNRSSRFVEFHIGMLAKEKDPLTDEDAIAAENLKEEYKQQTMDGFMPVDDGTRLPFD